MFKKSKKIFIKVGVVLFTLFVSTLSIIRFLPTKKANADVNREEYYYFTLNKSFSYNFNIANNESKTYIYNINTIDSDIYLLNSDYHYPDYENQDNLIIQLKLIVFNDDGDIYVNLSAYTRLYSDGWWLGDFLSTNGKDYFYEDMEEWDVFLYYEGNYINLLYNIQNINNYQFFINKFYTSYELDQKIYSNNLGGYNQGLLDGFNNGVKDVKDQPNSYQLFTIDQYLEYANTQGEQAFNDGYQRGILDSQDAAQGYANVMTSAFDGAASLFGVEIFPNITIGLIIGIPLLLILLVIILKIVRG